MMNCPRVKLCWNVIVFKRISPRNSSVDQNNLIVYRFYFNYAIYLNN